MTSEQKAQPEAQPLRLLKWCDGHWADLMFALKGYALDNQIAPTPEVLNEKFINGEQDPLWEAATAINFNAIQQFGIEPILTKYGGCPVCAYANIVHHVVDQVAPKFMETH